MKKIKWLTLLVLSLSLAACGTGDEISEKQQLLKQEGMELQASGDYAGAIKKYEEALAISDMKVEAEEIDIAYYKASAQHRSGDLAGAIDTYSATLAVKETEDSYLGRGLLYIAAGEQEKAKKDLDKVLEKTQDLLTQGIIYNALNDTVKAKQCFEKAQKEGNADAVFYLANIYEKNGDANYAMLLLEEYIAGGEAGADGYLCVAEKYFEAGEYDTALEMAQAGIALGESGVLSRLLQEEIACYEKLGNFTEAKRKAEDYLKKYPKDSVMLKEYEFLKSR